MTRHPDPDGSGAVSPPEGGWYDARDIVRVGEEGHVAIVGRAERFAKVGGEMVSLAAVEALASGVWQNGPLGSAALSCRRKGQKAVLAIANRAATLDALRAAGMRPAPRKSGSRRSCGSCRISRCSDRARPTTRSSRRCWRRPADLGVTER